MQIVYGFDINGVKYLVMDVNEALMNGESVRSISAYKNGIGADRVMFMDLENSSVIAIYNSKGKNVVPDLNDFQVAGAISDGEHHREYHVTDYYMSTVAVEEELKKIA